MKNFLPLLFASLFIPLILNAQTPEAFSYQAVVRNDQGQPITNQQVNIRISLLRGTATGEVIYSEEHSPTTTGIGKVALKIGKGTAITGDFSGIDWSNGPYFVKTELDETGGSNFKNMGTSQLLSVPYALQAKKAENTFSGNYNDLQNTPDIHSLVDTSTTTLWDKDSTDDFSGNYNSLTNKPDLSDTSRYLTSEMDPVFDTSLAAAITRQDTAQWNKKNPGHWTKEVDTLQYPEKLVKIGSDTTKEVNLRVRSSIDHSPGNSGLSILGRKSYLSLVTGGPDAKNAILNFNIQDTSSFVAYTRNKKLLRLGQRNFNDNPHKGILITYQNNVGIDTIPDEELHVDGAVRVEDTTSSPRPRTVYGNSMPLAYGFVLPFNSGTVAEGSYGIESANKRADGEYTVILENGWQGYPAINITLNSTSAVNHNVTQSFVDPNEIRIHMVDDGGSPVDVGFSIVVYGKLQ